MSKIKSLYRARKHAEKVRFKQEIKAIYHQYDMPKKKKTSSKVFLGLILGDFLMIEIFCMWFMATYPEYGDIGAFIGIAVAMIGQVGAVIGYFRKSTAENTVGGIVYDSAMKEYDSITADNSQAVG